MNGLLYYVDSPAKLALTLFLGSVAWATVKTVLMVGRLVAGRLAGRRIDLD